VAATLTSAAFICPFPLPQNAEQAIFVAPRGRGTWIRAGSKPNCLASTCTSCEALAREGDALNPNETATGAITTAKKMNRRMRHPTTMRPVIFGWIEQKYLYAPGVSNRWENCSSVSSTGDLNFCSVLTTL